MITTRESINYQFSLIFGYSSPNDITAGDVIGPGKLTRERVNELSQGVIEYLRMYNAILRDYTGSEVFSIEFELYNLDEKSARINIFPKSMIFIPGKYKDCESLLLALKPETGYLDAHKSHEAINNISKLFFEVEELPLSMTGTGQQINDLLAEETSEVRLILYGLTRENLFVLRLNNYSTVSQMIPYFHSELYKKLGVSIVDHVILEELLGLSHDMVGVSLDYSYDGLEAVNRVLDQEYQLACILSPVKPEGVKAIADSGDRMPRKSTYFYPKVPAGLVFHRFG